MPNKTIEDFAYQVRDYMRSAEVVEGKNLYNWGNIPFTLSKDGITITVVKNADGTIQYFDFDGTATAYTSFIYIDLQDNANSYHLFPEGDYVLDDKAGYVTGTTIQDKKGIYTYIPRKKGASGTTISGIDTATETHSRRFTVDYDEADYFGIAFFIWGGTVLDHYKLYPMLCTPEEWDKDNSYSPYYVPVKDRKLDIADQQVLGAWNLLPNNQIIQELYGVTFTVNDDKSVSLSGTMASNAPVIYGTCITNYKLPAGRYLLSGAPKGGSNSTYHSLVNIKHSNNTTTPKLDTGDGVWFDIVDGDTISVYAPRVDIGFRGQSTNGLVWHPQITKEPNQPYVPYAMTNRELTIQDLTSQMTFDTNLFRNLTSKLYVQGKLAILFLMGDVISITAANVYQTIVTLPIKSVFENVSQQFYWGTSTPLAVKIKTNGTVDIRIGNTSTGGINWIIPFVIE